MGKPITSKFSQRFIFVVISVSLNKEYKKLINGQFSVAIIDKKVRDNDQILLAKIFLKIKNKITETKEGKKQNPIKIFNFSDKNILFKKKLK